MNHSAKHLAPMALVTLLFVGLAGALIAKNLGLFEGSSELPKPADSSAANSPPPPAPPPSPPTKKAEPPTPPEPPPNLNEPLVRKAAPPPDAKHVSAAPPLAVTKPPSKPGKITVAYGSEKKPWLEWAAQVFKQTPEGKDLDLEMLEAGSLEAARLALDKQKAIHAWAPASSAYARVFERQWRQKYGGSPFISEERLALTPMVFVIWEERYQPFVEKYGEVSFRAIQQALQEKSGWKAIGNQPDWGYFKFGHTHPNKSNSGLITLLLTAYDFHQKTSGLTTADAEATAFWTWLKDLETAAGEMPGSTGQLMRAMVLKGPSAYDVVMVYENVALDQLKGASGRWGALRVVYPKRNLWNDNPYYTLATPGSSPAERDAAKAFGQFLLSERAQRKLYDFGFRPADAGVKLEGAHPFTEHRERGFLAHPQVNVEMPTGEVVEKLLEHWLHAIGR